MVGSAVITWLKSTLCPLGTITPLSVSKMLLVEVIFVLTDPPTNDPASEKLNLALPYK